jgi:hypothetical protein
MTRPLRETRAADAWVAFVRRWGSWAAIGIALMFVAGFVELSEEVLGGEDYSEEFLGADAILLRWIAQLRRPWLNGVAVAATRSRRLPFTSPLPSWSFAMSTPFASGSPPWFSRR